MAVAIICEFNPFHNGHKYLIQKAKQICKQPVIAIMSGSFTQRGEVAITDKFARTKTALQNGADLVLELPVAYAVSNAQKFAFAGVEIAKSFSSVNSLAFGCETDDISKLCTASNSIYNKDVKSLIKLEMNNGNYYPRAVEIATEKVFGKDISKIISTPNNILAVEYIRALSGCNIAPVPIKRIGVNHDSTVPVNDIASASYIRNEIKLGNNTTQFIPQTIEQTTDNKNLERILLYKLRSMSKDDFLKIADVSEGIENRIVNAVNSCNSIDDITSFIKSKRYTHARIRRILTCALLNISSSLQNTPIEYVRVLGFSDEGSSLLKTCNKSVVTSASDGLKLGGNIKMLLEKDIYATNISALAYKNVLNNNSDFTTPIIKI